MPLGRPTKYNQEILNGTLNYIENHLEFGDLVPSIAGLSCAIDIAQSTVHDWSNHEDKAEFSEMLRKIMSKQERMLLSGGLATADHGDIKSMNPAIVKLMLSKHNYSDKTESTVTINPLTEVIAQISGATIGPKSDD